MKITYDGKVGAWYFKLKDEKITDTETIQDKFKGITCNHINVDKDKHGEIIGIEILGKETP